MGVMIMLQVFIFKVFMIIEIVKKKFVQQPVLCFKGN